MRWAYINDFFYTPKKMKKVWAYIFSFLLTPIKYEKDILKGIFQGGVGRGSLEFEPMPVES